MLSRLSQWILRLLRGGKKAFWSSQRGKVRHEYVFDSPRENCRAMCISWPFTKDAVIRYFIPHYSDYGAREDEIFVYLIEDTIHELSHWADEDDWTKHNGVEKHWETWREVILREIEYVHDEVEIEW